MNSFTTRDATYWRNIYATQAAARRTRFARLRHAGYTIAEAARTIGVTPRTGNRYAAHLRKQQPVNDNYFPNAIGEVHPAEDRERRSAAVTVCDIALRKDADRDEVAEILDMLGLTA